MAANERTGKRGSRRIAVDGLTMHYRVSTERVPPGRVPVVLVPGVGLSGAYMVPLALHLAPDFTVYGPDLPGFGDSDQPREVLGVPGLADWLARWIRAAGLPAVAPLGNSFGCQVIADLAARYPELVDRRHLRARIARA